MYETIFKNSLFFQISAIWRSLPLLHSQGEYCFFPGSTVKNIPPLLWSLTEGMFRSPALAYSLTHLSNKWIVVITEWWLTPNSPVLTQTAQQFLLFKLPILEVKTFMLLRQITINFLPTHSIICHSCIDKSMETTSQKIMGILEKLTLLKDETPRTDQGVWRGLLEFKKQKNPKFIFLSHLFQIFPFILLFICYSSPQLQSPSVPSQAITFYSDMEKKKKKKLSSNTLNHKWFTKFSASLWEKVRFRS